MLLIREPELTCLMWKTWRLCLVNLGSHCKVFNTKCVDCLNGIDFGSKSVADLKARFPILQESMRTQLGIEMDRMVGEERFLKEEPDHLEISLRRCKKLTGTLVTLKRYTSLVLFARGEIYVTEPRFSV